MLSNTDGWRTVRWALERGSARASAILDREVDNPTVAIRSTTNALDVTTDTALPGIESQSLCSAEEWLEDGGKVAEVAIISEVRQVTGERVESERW